MNIGIAEIRNNMADTLNRVAYQGERIVLERRGKGVHVAGQDFPAHADAHVLFAVVEDGLSNRVLRGENQGRTLTHEAVVRSLQRIGLASGPSFELDVQPTLEASWKAPRFVAFVQELKSRKVLAAAELGP